ncbi:multifunctional CCA addition/repair protein [Permianibacter sp. IMCC34836]|uniref:multifunctional CCA addition/repair protein n=1 Tax=Permianibacter fluminis TaxID=2738515 RepID=UPI00155671D4|nr:multifunctional CCA addition/repair protein [Permianibacter fluminis]NQD36421.1 multifunctional CCA addition/repair protein [Permianibacter fluminis]
MKSYLVGGAVRDQLLGRRVTERDYVVVGATAEQMLALGYTQVGRDFPVFLHPETRAEYALARTERKSGHGYRGFVMHAAPDVTLEADLQRRDLTINAMALDDDGTLIDPYHGRADLDKKLLRHVSPAFAEDPVRVLRVARFAARYAPLGFTVAPETQALMQQMVRDGELDHLTPERVWQETAKALSEDEPGVYIEVLRSCGALKIIFPELDCLWGVPNPAQWHPEIDTGVHTLMVLAVACRISDNIRVRFAALVHDLGKGVTPAQFWPSHRGHEEAGVPIIEALATRLKLPNEFRDLAVLTSRFHLHFHRGFQLRPGTVLKVLMQSDALRRPERFQELLLACEADYRGREGWLERAYPQRAYWQQALAAVRAVPVQPLLDQGLQGQKLADHLHEHRTQAVAELRARLAHDSSELA